MTQDSKPSHIASLNALGERFASSVAISFSFLIALGFEACEQAAQDSYDIRDAAFVHRFIRANSALNVYLSVATNQIGVVVYSYDSAASCDRSQKPTSVTDLDLWTEQHGPIDPPPLPWMKTQTLHQDVRRSFRYYAKHAGLKLEETVEFMAQRLRTSRLVP